MVVFSEILRCHVIDARGARARISDLSVDLAEEDYPPVMRLFFINAEKQHVSLPWGAVTGGDWRRRRLEVADLGAARAGSPEPPALEVLLKRDILDALVLDLQHRRVARANDLWLGEEGGRLALRAADASLGAVLRRLSRGWLGRGSGTSLSDWKNVEFLRGDTRGARAGTYYERRIARLLPGEIAKLSEAVPYLHAAELLTLLPDPVAADALELMTPERQLQVFEELDESQALRLLALASPDIAADLVGRLGPEAAKQHLERLPAPHARRVIELLRYPEASAGGIMTNDLVYVAEGLTIEEARRVLAARLREPDFVYYVYVVDDEESRLLRGVVTLRNLLLADEGSRLGEVMNPRVLTVSPLAAAAEVAYQVIENHLAALPVVGQEGRLLGAVTVDAAVATVAPPNWRSIAPRVFS